MFVLSIFVISLSYLAHKKTELEMSPLYGYEIHPHHADHNEFVEVVFSDPSSSKKMTSKGEIVGTLAGCELVDTVDENEIMETGLDNPTYCSHSIFDNEKVIISFSSL